MKTIFFDLDGTLLSMDLELFISSYMTQITSFFRNQGRDVNSIVAGMSSGIKAMLVNDGKQTNEDVFWKAFSKAANLEREQMLDEFNTFYGLEFPKLKECVEANQYIVKAIGTLKEKGYTMYVTTNPIFPKMAVYERLRWAGLDHADFVDVTSYENSSYCKPNVEYYKQFMATQNVAVSECLMVGNDSIEDGAIQQLGVELYLIDDFLIHKGEGEPSCKYISNSAKFLEFVEKLPNV